MESQNTGLMVSVVDLHTQKQPYQSHVSRLHHFSLSMFTLHVLMELSDQEIQSFHVIVMDVVFVEKTPGAGGLAWPRSRSTCPLLPQLSSPCKLLLVRLTIHGELGGLKISSRVL